MYNWGYLKDSILAKLDLTEGEAENQNFLSQFPTYANEAMTQICSAVKPKRTFKKFEIWKDKQDAWNYCVKKYPKANYETNDIVDEPDEKNEYEAQFWSEYNYIVDNNKFVGELQNMYDIVTDEKGVKHQESDFISFGDDVCYQLITTKFDSKQIELNDNDYKYVGYNQLQFFHPGVFYISYNARWFDFRKVNEDNYMNNTPNDILDCIPSYVASQCLKIDDEYRATVFRNEYETLLARIDDTNYKNTKTLVIDGGW